MMTARQPSSGKAFWFQEDASRNTFGVSNDGDCVSINRLENIKLIPLSCAESYDLSFSTAYLQR
jgi:hypothetical protein